MPNEQFEEAKSLLNAIAYASKNGLELEFVESFLYEIKSGHTVEKAIYFALYEWDL